jgi:hypothetical protein
MQRERMLNADELKELTDIQLLAQVVRYDCIWDKVFSLQELKLGKPNIYLDDIGPRQKMHALVVEEAARRMAKKGYIELKEEPNPKKPGERIHIAIGLLPPNE